jgi:uncharacterized membrane protein
LLNPFKMNNWDFRTFFITVISFQLSLFGLISLDLIGLSIPYLGPYRQIVGFVFLTFIPGYTILRILDIHDANSSETVVYSVGLSVATLMFIGFFINLIGPLFGNFRPISTSFVLVWLNVVVLSLLGLAYLRDRDFKDYDIDNTPIPEIPKTDLYCVLSYILLVLSLTLVGTYFVNQYSNSSFLMLLLLVIAIAVPILAYRSIKTPGISVTFPILIYTISVALLLHTSLITPYLVGYDVHTEHFIYSEVMENHYWGNSSLEDSNLNPMLSITILPALFSIVLDLDGNMIFKIVYPLIFSFLPVVLYSVYNKISYTKHNIIAFFAVLYVLFIVTYYTEMIGLARQQIAELFLALVLLVIVSDPVSMKRRILCTIFLFSMVVSHYAITSLFLILIASAALLFELTTRCASKYAFISRKGLNRFSWWLILLFLIFSYLWYSYSTSNTVLFDNVYLFENFFNAINTELFVDTRATTLITTRSISPINQILKYSYLVSQLSIVVGILYTLWAKFISKNRIRPSDLYLCLSLVSCGILGVSFVTTNTGMNIHRVYHVASLILAPFCIIGGVFFIRSIYNRIISKYIPYKTDCVALCIQVLAVILSIFLLLNSGVINEVARDTPSSISLSQEAIKISGDPGAVLTLYYGKMYTTDYDISGIQWLKINRIVNAPIYTDCTLNFLAYGMITGSQKIQRINPLDNSYIFLGELTTRYNLVAPLNKSEAPLDLNSFAEFFFNRNKVYTNGNAGVLY